MEGEHMTMWMPMRGAIRLLPLAALVLASLVWAAPVQAGEATADPFRAGPSFDCARAATPDERAICADPLLSAIDRTAAEAYGTYQGEFLHRDEVARRFLSDRALCGEDRACLAGVMSRAYTTYLDVMEGKVARWIDRYAEALVAAKAQGLAEDALRSRSAWLQRAPQVVGQCALTRIAEVTTRFGAPASWENESEGTAIRYENEIWQVSYDRVGLDEAQAGHRVVLCLVSRPHDCPEGDTRGVLYYTLDVDARRDWVLGDSQHFCGGA